MVMGSNLLWADAERPVGPGGLSGWAKEPKSTTDYSKGERNLEQAEMFDNSPIHIANSL